MSGAAPLNPGLATQLNVRQNAQEINAYLKDLHNWSGDVKKKDEALKAGQLVLTKAAATPPPIRGSKAAVLLPSSASADEARFAEAKAAGNAAFAAGRFEESLTHYAQCMLLSPRDAVIPSNRAQALLKLQRWHEAEVDASAALALDPAAVKALFRRAQARRQLRKYALAGQDCAAIAKLDPANKPAQLLAQEVATLLKKQQEAKAKASQPVVTSAAPPVTAAAAVKQAAPAAAASGSVAPVASTTAPASGARRMVIQEDDDDEEDDEEETVPVKTAASVAVATATSAPKPHAAPSTPAAAAASATSPQKAAAASSSPAAPAANSVSTSSAASPVSVAPAAASAASSSAAATASSPSGLVAPASAFDFDSCFRSIRSNPSLVAAYLRLLPRPPLDRYPALMKTALEGGLLSSVAEALATEVLPKEKGGDDGALFAFQVLEGIAAVPRFNVARMMLTAQQKALFARVFRDISEQRTTTTKERVLELAARYGVKL